MHKLSKQIRIVIYSNYSIHWNKAPYRKQYNNVVFQFKNNITSYFYFINKLKMINSQINMEVI